MYLFRTLRSLKMRRKIAEQRRIHHLPLDREQKLAKQLDLFNRQWETIRNAVPYYQEYYISKRYPESFRSWQQVIDTLPVVDRDFVREKKSRIYSQSRPAEFWRATGGSTAKPLQLPAWKSERPIRAIDIWMARGWYGVTPADRAFLLWGHRHLLGQGFRAILRGWNRKVRDVLVGYHRYSAYDLTEESLRRCAQALIQFKPAYMFGYSVALDLLALASQKAAPELRKLGLKVIIGTAEGFPRTESARFVSETFGAPVAMEYGAVETGVIAHTVPEGGYEVFWNTFFVEATETGPNGGKILRLTSLYPRAFPLIRYELGDEVEVLPGDSGIGLTRFQKVLGRCNTFLVLENGAQIHSEAISHCVSDCPQIISYQAVQDGSKIELCYRATSPISPAMIEVIRERLGKIHPLLSGISITQVERLRQSIAGKTPMILRA